MDVGKTYCCAMSVDADRFNDAYLQKRILPFLTPRPADPEAFRRMCRQARDKGLKVFPPCDNVNAQGYCQGHACAADLIEPAALGVDVPAANIQWLTTTPSGRAHTGQPDDGRTGWKLHAIEAESTETLKGIGHRKALCGLSPHLGWDMDLFVNTKCSRCERALAIRNRRK